MRIKNYMTPLPKNYETCEILVEDKWIQATFFEADAVESDDGEEYWWFDYFCDIHGNTYPKDITKDGPLPEWRPYRSIRVVTPENLNAWLKGE